MPNPRSRAKNQLRVSSYDRVSTWILSMLVITCVTVAALCIIYFSRKFLITEFAVPVTPIASGGGGTGGKGGALGGDLEPPNAEDAAAVEESQMQDTLSALTSAVASRTTVLADESIDVDETTQAKGDGRTPGSGGGRGGGAGGGIGSGFGPGHGGTEPRREIRFEPASLLEYAQWLDFFKIELGVLGQDNKVYYAYNLSHDKPDVRVGDPAQETRLYMNPTDSQFAALDRQLAEKAGIADKGQIILQFFPNEAQAILINLEQKQAGARKPDTIRSTVFRVTHSGNNFEFSVADQTYR
ncbi:MAG TPA: hypothetical protein VH107_17230 [Lacipirellulaceae bacterium]|nr:hypothetical protein [Lacipirellulaceae bacterium]